MLPALGYIQKVADYAVYGTDHNKPPAGLGNRRFPVANRGKFDD